MSPVDSRPAIFAFALFLSLLVSPIAVAQTVSKVDPRALAMGGGYVAVADGYAALQWNPAGLWVSGRKEAGLMLGSLSLEVGRWVESLRVAGGFSDELTNADASATLMSGSSGLTDERTFGIYVTSVRFGASFQQITYADEIASFIDGSVHIDTAALRTREYQVSAAHPLMQGRLVLGGSVKLVQAQGRLDGVSLDSLEGADLAAGKLLGLAHSGSVTSEDTVFGIDLGLLFMASSMLRIGAVVKNFNAPELDSSTKITPANEGQFRLPRQVRIGGMFLPHPQFSLTLDLDLVSGVFVQGARERREFGGGIQWSGDRIALRSGLLFDLKAIERRPMYTFGFGLSGETLRADLAGRWNPGRSGFGWTGSLAAEF